MPNPSNSSQLDALINKMKSATSPFRDTIHGLHAKYKDLNDGKVADYIPELARADPAWFAISVVTPEGRTFDAGNYEQLFTIQSVSKPFLYGLALEDHGREAVMARVGVQPTRESFNSIMLDEVTNRPYNPMVNAGAIAVADLIEGKNISERVRRMLAMFGKFIGRDVYVDNAVFMSERATGHRNRAIACLMRNFNMVGDRIEESLELYFQQCSVMVHCRDLAVMGATLANGGVNPITGETALDPKHVTDVLSVMHTCGMYDFAGEWAYRVGIPAKSGVGGGIVAVVPGRLGIGVFSPPLDEKGNSVRGIQVCQDLSAQFGLHVFRPGQDAGLLDEQLNPSRGA
jgi:glutaminase